MGIRSRTGTATLALLVAVGAAAAADAQPREQPKRGGVLKVAFPTEPPTLDPATTITVINQLIVQHICETLYTSGEGREPVPMLAERHELDDGGRRYTITLRKAVRLHNGKEMTAADVVASLKRWGRLTPNVWRTVEDVAAKNAATVVIRLKEPSPRLLTVLASPRSAILPKEVVDLATGREPVKTIIGTRPFRLVEHKVNRHVRVARFEEYVARVDPPDYMGGKRTAWVDEILFIPVPDPAARLAGVQAGQYHFGMLVKPDEYERIGKMDGVEPRVVKFATSSLALLNHRKGLMTSKKIRQAIQAALDMEPILMSAIGHPFLYRLEGSIFSAEAWPWHSTAGTGAYNQGDRDKARRLLGEAGYAGQAVRLLAAREVDYHYKSALAVKQQLEEVGLTIDFQALDFPTIDQRLRNPDVWDVISYGWVFVPDPAFLTPLYCWGATGWCNEEKERLLAELRRETDLGKRKAMMDRIQTLFYEDVGYIKYGEHFPLDVVRKELRGDFRSQRWAFFWNAWLEKK